MTGNEKKKWHDSEIGIRYNIKVKYYEKLI